jgi:hypothetical protein
MSDSILELGVLVDELADTDADMELVGVRVLSLRTLGIELLLSNFSVLIWRQVIFQIGGRSIGLFLLGLVSVGGSFLNILLREKSFTNVREHDFPVLVDKKVKGWLTLAAFSACSLAFFISFIKR